MGTLLALKSVVKGHDLFFLGLTLQKHIKWKNGKKIIVEEPHLGRIHTQLFWDHHVYRQGLYTHNFNGSCQPKMDNTWSPGWPVPHNIKHSNSLCLWKGSSHSYSTVHLSEKKGCARLVSTVAQAIYKRQKRDWIIILLFSCSPHEPEHLALPGKVVHLRSVLSPVQPWALMVQYSSIQSIAHFISKTPNSLKSVTELYQDQNSLWEKY